MVLPLKFGPNGKTDNATHTPRGYQKKLFLGRAERAPKWVQKWLGKARTEGWLALAFTMIREGGAGGKVLEWEPHMLSDLLISAERELVHFLMDRLTGVRESDGSENIKNGDNFLITVPNRKLCHSPQKIYTTVFLTALLMISSTGNNPNVHYK